MNNPQELQPNNLSSDQLPAASSHYDQALDCFIEFWGEMASNWGINRTMAQIHALLYASEKELDTDEIMARLKISRGNASMNLRSLMSWDLVRKLPHSGSRKDYFTAEQDVWKITGRIIHERQRREINPVLQKLQACRDTLSYDVDGAIPMGIAEEIFCERIDNLMQLMDVFEGFTRAILPFIQVQNTELIKQFIRFAEAFQKESTK